MPENADYAIVLAVSVAICLTLAMVAWRRRTVPGGTYFALMMLAGAEWSMASAIEALSRDLSTKIMWAQICYVGMVSAPVFFMLFALSYWRPDIKLKLPYHVLIWIMPLITVIVTATNGLHGLMWDEFSYSSRNSDVLIYGHGVWFYVAVAYFYLTVWIGVIFLFRAAVSLSRIYRRQALTVLIATALPWIANALYVFGFNPLPGVDLAPITFSITGLILAFGMVQFQLFKVLPVARELVYKRIENGVLVLNDAGRIVEINPAAQSMIGLTLEVGQNAETAFKDWPRLSFPLSRDHQRLEVLLSNRASPIWLDVIISPLYDRSNKPSGHLIMLNDISERKRIEEALRQSEERFRYFIELLPEAVCEIDTNGNILLANHKAFLMSGYDRADLSNGLTIYTMIASEDKDRAAANVQRMIDGESMGADEYTLVRKDGSKYPALVHIGNIVQGNKTTGFRCVIVDITEHKRAEEKVRESEVKYRFLTEKMNDMVWTMGMDFRNTYISPSISRVLGFTPEERIGQSAKDHMTPQSFKNMNAVLAAELERDGREGVDPNRTVTLEAEHYHRNGSTVWLEHVISAVRDGRGNIVGLYGVSRDITERKKAEEARQQLAVIVESSHDAIFSKTLDGIITTWNKGAQMLYGYTAEEVMGRSASVLAPPELAGESQQFLEQIKRGEAVKDYETIRITKDKKRINVLLTMSPIKDTLGQIIGASAIAQDITILRRASEILKQSERKYRELFENANEAIFVAQNEKLVFINPMLSRMFGYSDAELSAKPFIAFIHPDDRGMVIDRHKRRLKGEELPSSYTFRIIHANGNIRFVELSSVLVEWDGGPATLNFLSDITARMQAEEALRLSEQKFKDLAEQLPLTIFEIDLEGRFVYANRYGLEFHGYAWDEAINSKNAMDFFVPEQRQRVIDNMARVLHGEKYDHQEYNVLRKDGGTYPALIYANAVIQDGRPIGVRGVIVDITERKYVEQMKSDFVSFISHQLRTPVAGLMAYIDNMLDGITGKLNVKQIEYLNEMRDVCARGNRLIADLLNISRLERGVISVNIVPVDLREKVDMAVREYRTSVEEKGLSLEINELGKGISVLADSDKLVEVLKNLIHNAYKFTKAGSISVEISSRGNQGIVKVRDTGNGMTEAVMKDLFKREKVFSGAVAAGGGAGLGLYIAKGFMKLQGGDITVESVPGEGSTFIVSLPRQ